MSISSGLTRRQVLCAATSALAAPCIVPASALGLDGNVAASSRLSMALIGAGNQGQALLGEVLSQRQVQVRAVCDVDAARRGAAKSRVEQASAAMGKSADPDCAEYVDFRDVLARQDIDTVLIATPDHWHVPIAVLAARAGKDIYCEKPLTRSIAEGRLLADTVKGHGRILQTGSQQRSCPRFGRACELVRSGRIGALQTIRVGLPEQNAHLPGPQPTMPVPAGLDYDRWLGPAPFAPYTGARTHYYFRFLLDYSGGQVTNFGAHDLDVAQWAMDMDHSGPVEIEGRGLFPADAFYTTATQVDVQATYANGVRLYCRTDQSYVLFEGSEGWVKVSRSRLEAPNEAILAMSGGFSEERRCAKASHMGDFLDCVRTRRQPLCPAETGHRTATVCHLANLAMLLKRRLRWDPGQERFVDDAEANRLLWRAGRAPYDWV